MIRRVPLVLVGAEAQDGDVATVRVVVGSVGRQSGSQQVAASANIFFKRYFCRFFGLLMVHLSLFNYFQVSTDRRGCPG